jgi:hypothetical protein
LGVGAPADAIGGAATCCFFGSSIRAVMQFPAGVPLCWFARIVKTDWLEIPSTSWHKRATVVLGAEAMGAAGGAT